MDIKTLGARRNIVEHKSNNVSDWLHQSIMDEIYLNKNNFREGNGKEEYEKLTRKLKKVRAANECYKEVYESEYQRIFTAYKDRDEELFMKLTEDGMDFLLSKLLLKFMSKHLKKIDRLLEGLKQY